MHTHTYIVCIYICTHTHMHNACIYIQHNRDYLLNFAKGFNNCCCDGEFDRQTPF